MTNSHLVSKSYSTELASIPPTVKEVVTQAGQVLPKLSSIKSLRESWGNVVFLPTKSWVVNSRLNRFYLYWLSTPSIVRDGSWTLEDNRWILSCNSRMSVCVCIWLTKWSRSGIAKYCSRKNVWWRWSASGSKSITWSLMYCVLVLKSSLPWRPSRKSIY